MNFGTWQSAIYGLAHAEELIPLRKQLKEKLFNKSLPKSDYPLKKRYLVFTFVRIKYLILKYFQLPCFEGCFDCNLTCACV